ncbi:MAG: DNA alkylation repair protein [Clostridia bacterium]|nr:DNA alkylation repair protein [Clostridia bacterium]
MQKNISVSILDSKNIPESIRLLKTVAIHDNFFQLWIHFDVMDGKFVPHTGVDIQYIKTAKNLGFYVDTHLMVENPIGDKYIEKVIEYGTDTITIHYEIPNFEIILKRLVALKKELYENEKRILTIGISIKPDTSVEVLKKYNDLFDLLLIMSVEPGLGGQTYLNQTNDKIKEAKELFSDKIIQVDGGIHINNIEEPLTLGVDSFVVGSYLTKNNMLDNLLKLNILKYLRELPKDGNLDFDKKLLMITPGGYGEKDILLGISVPTMRGAAKFWYKKISLSTLDPFISSKYHDDRRFAIFCMSNMVKQYYAKKDIEKINDIVKYMQKNIKYINNWDLTDETAPNILGYYLLLLNEKERKKEVETYTSKEDIWMKRIGIVSLLNMPKNGYTDFCIKMCEPHMYHEHHLIQKAIGWVLREAYKKEPKKILELLVEKNEERKLPNILLSYACEKMSGNEKKMVKRKQV